MRKTKSQHVHCECHQKGHTEEDCPDNQRDGEHIPHTCCCQHNSRCTCSLKKEQKEQKISHLGKFKPCDGRATVSTEIDHSNLLGTMSDREVGVSTTMFKSGTHSYPLNHDIPLLNSQQDGSLLEHFPERWFTSYNQASEYGSLPVVQPQFNSDGYLGDLSMNNYNYVPNEPPFYDSLPQFEPFNPLFTSPGAGVSEMADCASITQSHFLPITGQNVRNDVSALGGAEGWNRERSGVANATQLGEGFFE